MCVRVFVIVCVWISMEVSISVYFCLCMVYIKETPWLESASEIYRPRDRSLSAKLVSAFVGRECHLVSVKDSYGRILGFLDRSCYFFFK
jgi:hypothetical protein